MRKKHFLIALSLLGSLFIYLFYRTEKTLINEIAVYLVSPDHYDSIKNAVVAFLPLSEPVVYSLPEGLWVFCITLTSQQFYLRIMNRKINCIVFPLIFSIGLEIFQLLQLTNGRFDVLDILFAVIFWIMARILFKEKIETQSIFNPISLQSIVCLLTYGIVYLAHVLE